MTALVLRKGISSHLHLLHYSVATIIYNWIPFRLLLISVCWFHNFHSSSAFGVWKFDAPDDSLTQMTVNPKNGDVFAAGDSVLYQLTRDLQVKRTYNLRTEPNSRCQTKSECRARNDAGILLEIESNGELLLHCENVVRSMCSVFLAENLSHVGQLVFGSSHGNRTESNRALVGTFGGDDSHREFGFFIASSYDRNLSNISAEIVQVKWERSPASFTSFNQKIGFDANDSGTEQQKTFDVQYLYGFENNNFVYFLTVQQDSTLESFSYETRLARVCKDDQNFVSYTEVTLICVQSISSRPIFYNIAVTAHKAPAGEEYVDKFHLSPNSSALYVVFGESLEYSSDINDEEGYGLCVFPMDDIEDFFARAQRECYEGLGRLLEWINHDAPRCSTDVSLYTSIIPRP